MTRVLFVIPPGFPDMTASHEGTSGMGLLVPSPRPAGGGEPPRPFLYPPHTLAMAAGAARAAGLDVAFVDGSYARDPYSVARAAAAAAADVIAVQVASGTALADESFLRMLGAAGVRRPTLLFGASAHLCELIGAADAPLAVLAGEPEGALARALELAARGELTGRIEVSELAGAQYAGRLLRDLDALPFAAWDVTPWDAYRRVSLATSRGCPAGCRYCAYTVAQGVQHRSQSVERAFAEWEWLHRTIRPPRVVIRDPVFAHDRARVAALCERVAAQGVPLPFLCESRPEHFDLELLRLLKAAGCRVVQLGLESGDPAMLMALGRVPDLAAARGYLARVQEVAAHCRRLELECRVFVMAGLPGATASEAEQTRSALARLAPGTLIQAAAYRMYPGVALAAQPMGVLPATLEALRNAQQPAAAPWQRLWRRLRPATQAAGRQASPAGAAPRPAADAWRDAAASLAGVRVFLTGGNGFVGGHVAAALTEAGAAVTALVRPGSAAGMLADLPVEIVHGDLTEPAAWEAALRGAAVCCHVAARYGTADQAREMYAVNVRGTIALLAACSRAGVARFVHTGTIGTVGRPATADLPDERTPFNRWDAASHYVRSKYLGEQAALAWNTAGLTVVVVKPTAPVGPGDARPSATGRRIRAVLRGETPAYPPGGVNHAPVRDIAIGHVLAAARGQAGQSYILGHRDGNLRYAAFARLVTDAAGLPPLTGRAAPQQGTGLLDALTADPARAINELGLPQSDLVAAFAGAVAWFRADAGDAGALQRGAPRREGAE